MVCLNPLERRIAEATGKVIRDDTSNTPTILMDDAMTNATIIMNMRWKPLTGIPEAFACSSSKEIKNNSL